MAILAMLTGCSTNLDGNKYVEMEPKFELKQYFNGKIKAWGIIQDRSGEVISRFDIDMNGSWDNNGIGTLEENFYYYDTQKKEKRIWTIRKTKLGTYLGEAGDIIGEATGKSYGNAIRWSYDMNLPVKNTTYKIHFEDWMWAMRDEVVINRSYLKKWGFNVAEITIFMQKQP